MINWSNFKVVGRELECLVDAFQSGWVSGGPYVIKLEEELERIFQDSTALCVSNGTSALQLAFQVLSLRPGDEVIVPAFCFQAASNVLHQLGAVPVFSDIDPLNWNQTLQSIGKVRTKKTVGVVVVHNYGASASISEISNWSKREGLWLIEDCAESWFTKYDNRFVGQYGEVATFSMHATKTISSGEGGVLLVNDRSLVEKARLMRSHGLNRKTTQYLHECAGNNYRLSNLLAAVGYAQLESRDVITQKQLRNVEHYRDNLKNHWAISMQISLPSSRDHLWAVAISIWFDGLILSRNELIDLLYQLGIETRPGFYPASRLSYNSELSSVNAVVADRLHETIIVLPCSLTLSAEEIKGICNVLIDVLDRSRKYPEHYIQKASEITESKKNIERFYGGLLHGRKSFRYFEKRSFDVIDSHITTLLIELGGATIGYGHLELEHDKVWLGIALADEVTGQGWGKLMMFELLKAAKEMQVNDIYLKVDHDNLRAIKLYKSFGFELVSNESVSETYRLKLGCNNLEGML
jgi:perosamine synthetase